MSVTHHAECDRANESDNMDYWASYTYCGFDVYQNENMQLSDDWRYVSCKRCLKRKERDDAADSDPLINPPF